MIEVGAAVIEDERGYILIARRKPGKPEEGLWEFPGGKLEAGETVQSCIKRELQEEMNLDIEPGELLGTSIHTYGERTIRLHACMASYKGGEVQLADHDRYTWVARNELSMFNFAPADLKFVDMLTAGESPL
ncbi:(deoxy)nucleoside triphosphate pyrophosphohydrolase [Paenibacillus tarimensis]|uniref:(deoxy)nucleoside triphosphate pyrophosphohydrolase n=1 Tax=Paenibacillus tarimensis TaxID=416012 RepID=UPI001F48B959|nr:(deoxy)nucleoside triphosphate pyrophosphohydrolase [Paenibacillus tarimensis]MCF2945720.1 (deoxy)nucleoside triphosphate pyrophosphohydrolase [Paenibacillus tarimensis]